jgi:hypothetical protein
MSFEEFVDRTAPSAEASRHFDNSAELLPAWPNPTPEQSAELAEKARAIALEIGRKFDALLAEHTARTTALYNQLNAYWQAPAPWGMLPTPPPLALFQQWAGSLLEWRNVCRGFETDAEKLVKAGMPQFKTYLKQCTDDLDKALETIKKTNTSLFSASPANYGAPPGPMPGMGMAGGGGPFSPEEFSRMQQDHQRRSDSFSDSVRRFTDYLKS